MSERDRNGMTAHEGYSLGVVLGAASYNTKLEAFLMELGLMLHRRRLNERRREAYRLKRFTPETPAVSPPKIILSAATKGGME